MEKQIEYPIKQEKKTKKIKPFQDPRDGWQINILSTLFDYIILNLTPSEYIVLSYMIRKIQGWGKESDKISHNQIVNNTMINSGQTVSTAIKGLVEKGMITKSRKSSREIMNYSLDFDFELEVDR